jgi:hypothetical protein
MVSSSRGDHRDLPLQLVCQRHTPPPLDAGRSTDPLVSVIIVTWTSARSRERAGEVGFEVIVVDNGSLDNEHRVDGSGVFQRAWLPS